MAKLVNAFISKAAFHAETVMSSWVATAMLQLLGMCAPSQPYAFWDNGPKEYMQLQAPSVLAHRRA